MGEAQRGAGGSTNKANSQEERSRQENQAERGKRAFPEIAAARDPRNNLSSGNREGGTVRKYLPPPPPPSLLSLGARHILLEIAPAEREGDG